MRHLKTIALFAVLTALSIVAGCASGNGVKLTYKLGPSSGPCPGKAVIHQFEDKRGITRLGADKSGEALQSLSDEADWVSWAFFDELKASGCDVSYRTSTLPSDNETVVSGELLELALNQTGTTTYEGKVTVKVVLTKAGKIVHSEKFSSQVEDVVVPGYGDRSDILEEALRGITEAAIPTICSKL